MVGILPDGRIAVVDSTTYEVKIMELGGEVQQLFQRPFSPREVARRDREAEKERQLEAMSASGGLTIMMRTDEGTTSRMASGQARAMIESRIESMAFAPEIPVVVGVAVQTPASMHSRNAATLTSVCCMQYALNVTSCRGPPRVE